MSDIENLNELTDDDLENVFDDEVNGEDETLPTKAVEQNETGEEQTDEDLQNLFKVRQKSDNEQDKSVNKVDGTQQKQQQSGSRGQDLVDANGNVIAKAGAERRFYEENQRMKQEMAKFNNEVLPQIRQQYQEMQNELTQYKGVMEGLHAKDLSPQDIQSGLDFVRNWKQDPKGVVKFLLTSLQASGIDIDIDGMQTSVQAAAIKQMIDEKFAPFMKEREEAERIAAEEAEVEQNYNNFVARYPDSVVHDKTLAFMIRKDPSLTPEVAYLRLKNYYLRNNLDFTKSLEELSQVKTTQPNVGLPQNPIISDNVATRTRQQRVANVGTSMNDIIKGAMTDAGF